MGKISVLILTLSFNLNIVTNVYTPFFFGDLRLRSFVLQRFENTHCKYHRIHILSLLHCGLADVLVFCNVHVGHTKIVTLCKNVNIYLGVLKSLFFNKIKRKKVLIRSTCHFPFRDRHIKKRIAWFNKLNYVHSTQYTCDYDQSISLIIQ